MKKIILLIIIAVLFIPFIFAAKVDYLIEQELQKEFKVKVIVHLYEKENESPFSINKKVSSQVNLNNKKREFTVIPGFIAEVTSNELEKLKQNENVKAIYLDKKYKISLEDSRKLINATEAVAKLVNDINITGKSQTICVLDTGVNYTHESLGGCSQSTFTSGHRTKVIAG